jgi:hypothetical protein
MASANTSASTTASSGRLQDLLPCLRSVAELQFSGALKGMNDAQKETYMHTLQNKAAEIEAMLAVLTASSAASPAPTPESSGLASTRRKSKSAGHISRKSKAVANVEAAGFSGNEFGNGARDVEHEWDDEQLYENTSVFATIKSGKIP